MRMISTKGLTEDQWKELRRNGIGGSDAAAALGISPWKSQRQLYLEKVGEYEAPLFNEEAVYWGKVLEEKIADRFQELNPDVDVRKVEAIIISPNKQFMFANIDREIVSKDGRNGILEIKTANARKEDDWENDNIPTQYILQLQHYLAVTGYDYGYLACLIGGQHYVQKYVERDEEIINQLYEKEEEFWNMVTSRTIPEWSGSELDEELSKQLSQTVIPNKEVELPQDKVIAAQKYEAAYQKYQEYAQILKEVEAEKNIYKEQLIELLGDAERGTLRTTSGQIYQIVNKLCTKKAHTVKASTYRKFSFKVQ